MSEHFLNCSEICTSLNHMCRERVSEGMRTDVFSYSGFGCKVFNYCEDHCPGKATPTTVKKKDILIMNHRKTVSVLFININLLQCFLANRYKSLLITFTCYNNKFFTIMYICKT